MRSPLITFTLLSTVSVVPLVSEGGHDNEFCSLIIENGSKDFKQALDRAIFFSDVNAMPVIPAEAFALGIQALRANPGRIYYTSLREFIEEEAAALSPAAEFAKGYLTIIFLARTIDPRTGHPVFVTFELFGATGRGMHNELIAQAWKALSPNNLETPMIERVSSGAAMAYKAENSRTVKFGVISREDYRQYRHDPKGLIKLSPTLDQTLNLP